MADEITHHRNNNNYDNSSFANNNIYTVFNNKHFNNNIDNPDPPCFISEEQEFIELLPTASFLSNEVFSGTNEHGIHGRNHYHRQQQQQPRTEISSSCVNSEERERQSNDFIGSESANDSNENDSESKPQSAWLRWSHERRASFKRRVEILEQRHFQLKNNRLSSPVRKARQESIRFVSPELKNIHLQGVESPMPAWTSNNGATATDDDEAFSSSLYSPTNERFVPSTVAEAAMAAARKGKGKKGALNSADELDRKLTPAQWKVLMTYWEHKTFKRSRLVGLVLSTAALIAMSVSFLSAHWVIDVDHKHYGLSKYGLWKICSVHHNNCSSHHLQFDGRRIAVICLSIFPILFDGVSLILILCGMCASNLAKKIYYYHSAGEIHLLCAISCVLALVCYLYLIEEASTTFLPSSTILPSYPPTPSIHPFNNTNVNNFAYKMETKDSINLMTKIEDKSKQDPPSNSLGFCYFTMVTSCLLLIGAWLCMCADELLKNVVNCKLKRLKRRQCVTDTKERRQDQQHQQNSQQQQLLLQQQKLQDQLNQQQIQLQLLQFSHHQQLLNMQQQQPLLGTVTTPLQFVLPTDTSQQQQQLMQHLVHNNWTNNLKS